MHRIAAIPGAEVRVIDTSTNTSFTTVTNNAGRYILPQVTPGTYSIVFSKPGFSNFQVIRAGGPGGPGAHHRREA